MKKSNEDVNLVDLSPQIKDKLYDLEKRLGKEIVVTSGYRSPEHSAEKNKLSPGEHTYGNAVDVASIGGSYTYMLVSSAIEVGFTRIGINRKSNFVHLGIGYPGAVPETIWTY